MSPSLYSSKTLAALKHIGSNSCSKFILIKFIRCGKMELEKSITNLLLILSCLVDVLFLRVLSISNFSNQLMGRKTFEFAVFSV